MKSIKFDSNNIFVKNKNLLMENMKNYSILLKKKKYWILNLSNLQNSSIFEEDLNVR